MTPRGRRGSWAAPGERRRPLVLAVLLAVAALGLVVAKLVPDPVGDLVGDLLYAVAAYVLVLLVVPRARPVAAGAIALGWCWCVEFAQALPGFHRLLDAVPAAALVLGSTFNPRDLLLYLLGAALAMLADAALRRPAPPAECPVSPRR